MKISSLFLSIIFSGLFLTSMFLPQPAVSSNDPVIFLGQIGQGNWKSWDVAIAGSYAYVIEEFDGHGLRVVDISNPTMPVEVASLAGGGVGIDVSGEFAYIARMGGGLTIVNISDPTNPIQVSNLADGSPRSIKVINNTAYVAGDDGLLIIDVQNPTMPTLVGQYNSSETFLELDILGNYAFVAAGSVFQTFKGLRVIDISNPSVPTLAGSLTLSMGTFDVVEGIAVSGNHAFVTTWSTGVHVINISSPTNPLLTASLNPAGTQRGITVSNDYAYATKNPLVVIDVSSPNNPTIVGSYSTPTGGRDLTIRNQYIFVADEYDGLVILWFAPPISGNIPESGGTLNSTIDSTNYIFPSGSFADTVEVTHTPLPPHMSPMGLESDSITEANDLVSLNLFFETTAVFVNSGQPAQLLPGMAYTLTWRYESDEIGTVSESDLAFYYWSGENWVRESTTIVDTVNNTVVANPNRISTWGLFAGPSSPTADFSASPRVGVPPLSVSFTNFSSGEFTSSLWDFGDGNTSVLTNPTHTYTEKGSYTVMLTVSGELGDDSMTKDSYIIVVDEIFDLFLPIINQ